MGQHLDAHAAQMMINIRRKIWDAEIQDGLDDIDAEKPYSPKRAAAAGAFGGILRKLRAEMRARLALAVAGDLEIEPTIRTGQLVMWKMFGAPTKSEAEFGTLTLISQPRRGGGASHKMLAEIFAQPGRTAEEKFVLAAQRKLADARATPLCRRGWMLYGVFSQHIDERVGALKQAMDAKKQKAGV